MKSETLRKLFIVNWFVLIGTLLPAAMVTFSKNEMFLQELNFHTVMCLLAIVSLSVSLLSVGFVENEGKQPTPTKHKRQQQSAKILPFERR